MLGEIFTSEECARCRLCCNFHASSAWESPFFTDEQAANRRREGTPIERRRRGGPSFAFRFVGDEARDCPALDRTRGCRLEGDEKPFECRLWPVRVMERDGRIAIGKYRDCPAIQGERGARLDRLVREKLLPDLLDFIRRNPQALRPWAPEYDLVWEAPNANDREE